MVRIKINKKIVKKVAEEGLILSISDINISGHIIENCRAVNEGRQESSRLTDNFRKK